MDTGKVSSTVSASQQQTNKIAGQASAAAKTAQAAKQASHPKTDTAEISNRNPANKKEIMATYSNLRTQMPNLQKQAIVSAMQGGSSALNIQAPAVQTKPAAPAQTTTETAAPAAPKAQTASSDAKAQAAAPAAPKPQPVDVVKAPNPGEDLGV